MDHHAFYAALFRDIEAEYGAFASDTLTAVIGFSAGGPVSLSYIPGKQVYASCELAAYPGQVVSTDGLKYELFTVGLPEEWSRKALTAIGDLSWNAELGDGHTVDLSEVFESPRKTHVVRLELFSQIDFQGTAYGIYRVALL